MERRQVLAAVPVLLAGCTGGSPADEPTTETTARPTHESTAFELTDAGCGSEDAERASVAFDDAAVTVTGAVVGANTCYRARVGDARYDAESGAFTLLVESYDASGPEEACGQCITVLEYEAVATFEGGLPETVVVKHGGYVDTHTVASASP